MTKADLIGAIVEKAEIPKVKASKAIDAIIETISEALKRGEKVQLVGFGSFCVRKRKAMVIGKGKRKTYCSFFTTGSAAFASSGASTTF